MSEIEEYQRRISAALDRIGRQLDAQSEADDAQTVAELQRALDDEKLANEQLEERVKALKDSKEAMATEIDDVRAQSTQALAKLDRQLQSLRQANEQLRQNNTALRIANSEGVGEAHLINKSMMAELESLRASREADRAETDAVMAELQALIDSASDAGANEQENA
ncbi:hypothetical protein [Roseovarius rhodophyticola]|uniref:Uncharacterized protein n=1 Tax=Roseovarius rhodophyticola TaxID=3080827 RepID=A0ABZ2TFQ1_9RHOB|nr:hypothetical protein [Roseovarius sp. W115]MDV2928358.1 hypothetical protein [Roseovarius sp. W115]